MPKALRRRDYIVFPPAPNKRSLNRERAVEEVHFRWDFQRSWKGAIKEGLHLEAHLHSEFRQSNPG